MKTFKNLIIVFVLAVTVFTVYKAIESMNRNAETFRLVRGI